MLKICFKLLQKHGIKIQNRTVAITIKEIFPYFQIGVQNYYKYFSLSTK